MEIFLRSIYSLGIQSKIEAEEGAGREKFVCCHNVVS